MSSSNTRFASTRDVARRLDVDMQTVRRWCRNRDVRAVLTPGGRGQYRIEVDERGFPVRN